MIHCLSPFPCISVSVTRIPLTRKTLPSIPVRLEDSANDMPLRTFLSKETHAPMTWHRHLSNCGPMDSHVPVVEWYLSLRYWIRHRFRESSCFFENSSMTTFRLSCRDTPRPNTPVHPPVISRRHFTSQITARANSRIVSKSHPRIVSRWRSLLQSYNKMSMSLELE